MSDPTTMSGKPPRVTIREVAALAGVSLKTVSRVVNDEPGVSADLVARVRVAVERLGYRPNATASALRRRDGRTATIGLLLEDVGNPYSSAVHRAVEDAARGRGVVVFAASSDEDPERERDAIEVFTGRRVDGLIMMPASHDQSYLLAERRNGTAVVVIDRPPAFIDVDSVTVDNRAGAETGVRHLLDQGHRRIAYLGDLDTIATAAQREVGYRQAHVAGGVAVDGGLVRTAVRSSAAAADAVVALLDLPDPPTALFAAQNLITIGAVRALRAVGRHHEIALVGFDDFVLAELLDPAVTVVMQDPGAVGAAAAKLLFGRIDGDRTPSHHVVLPTTLVARGSGEIAPSGGRTATAG
jgi:LacI family transcriptional regulator